MRVPRPVIRKLPANKLKTLRLFLFSVFRFPFAPKNGRWLLFFCFTAIFGSFFCFHCVCCCALTLSLMLIDDVDWKDWCDEPIIKSGPSLSPSSFERRQRVPQLSKCWWGHKKNERMKFENCGNVEKWKSCCKGKNQASKKRTQFRRDEVPDLLTVTHILAKLQSWGREQTLKWKKVEYGKEGREREGERDLWHKTATSRRPWVCSLPYFVLLSQCFYFGWGERREEERGVTYLAQAPFIS